MNTGVTDRKSFVGNNKTKIALYFMLFIILIIVTIFVAYEKPFISKVTMNISMEKKCRYMPQGIKSEFIIIGDRNHYKSLLKKYGNFISSFNTDRYYVIVTLNSKLKRVYYMPHAYSDNYYLGIVETKKENIAHDTCKMYFVKKLKIGKPIFWSPQGEDFIK